VVDYKRKNALDTILSDDSIVSTRLSEDIMEDRQILVRVGRDIYEQLQALATSQERSVSWVAKKAVEAAAKSPSLSSPNGFPPQPIYDNNIPPLSLTPPIAPPINKPTKRGSRLSDEWAPSVEQEQYARDLGLDPKRVAEDFRDYWTARADKGAVKADWGATWRTWCRKQAEAPQRASYGQQGHVQRERPGQAAARMFMEQFGRIKDVDHE
jgi:hypothetical protein